MVNPYREYRDCDVLWVERMNDFVSQDVLKAECSICDTDVRSDKRDYHISRIMGDSKNGYQATHDDCVDSYLDE